MYFQKSDKSAMVGPAPSWSGDRVNLNSLASESEAVGFRFPLGGNFFQGAGSSLEKVWKSQTALI